MSFHFRVERLVHKLAVGVWIVERIQNEVFIAKPIKLEMERTNREQWYLPDPTIELPDHAAMEMIRALVDALEESTLLEKNKKPAQHIEAMKEHLGDMRKMSDKLLAIIGEKL